jgi:D-alanyl-D-alanine carboxypeptidase/D-alanyl-D-alanine-endopeptidase (penicillin-binding protein 4)
MRSNSHRRLESRPSQSALRREPAVFALAAALVAGLAASAAMAASPRPRATVPAPPVTDGASGKAPVGAGADRSRLAEKLRSAVAGSGLKQAELGLWVGIRSDAGLEPVYGLNQSKQFIPASLSKLVTAAAALRALEPTHKFKTQLAALAEPQNGAIDGSLYLIGGGDPSFVSENMWALVNELLRSGTTQVSGDVVVDDGRFDRERFDEDRESVRVDRAYDAPVGAMSMNWNSVNVYVRPGPAPGAPARVFADPACGYLKVRNQATTSASGGGKSISVERKAEDGFPGDVIVVSGKIPAGHDEVVVYKNITKPDLWAGYQLVEFLKQRGITVKGSVRAGPAPQAAKALATSESKPLSMIVADMAKWSNNYVAEMLMKNLAAEAGQRPATMKGGIAEANKYLAELGFKDYGFVNASGFTRDNHFAPEQLGRFLEAVRGDFTIFPEYLAALPVAGVDGTLRSRMRSSQAAHWVRAKTGLLAGAVGLAGFAGLPSGRVATFVFIYNGSGREDVARAFFDRMAGLLAEE